MGLEASARPQCEWRSRRIFAHRSFWKNKAFICGQGGQAHLGKSTQSFVRWQRAVHRGHALRHVTLAGIYPGPEEDRVAGKGRGADALQAPRRRNGDPREGRIGGGRQPWWLP